jgi:hypothetical protein
MLLPGSPGQRHFCLVLPVWCGSRWSSCKVGFEPLFSLFLRRRFLSLSSLPRHLSRYLPRPSPRRALAPITVLPAVLTPSPPVFVAFPSLFPTPHFSPTSPFRVVLRLSLTLAIRIRFSLSPLVVVVLKKPRRKKRKSKVVVVFSLRRLPPSLSTLSKRAVEAKGR